MAVRTFSNTKVIWAIFYWLTQLLQVIIVIFNQSIFNLVENCKVHVYESCAVISSSSQFHWLHPTRLLCPGKTLGNNFGVGCCFPLQRIFWPEMKPRSPALQADSLPSELSRLMSKLKIDFYLKHIDKFLQGIYWLALKNIKISILSRNLLLKIVWLFVFIKCSLI